MDEIIPNLWIGDLPSALDTEILKSHNIRSVLTQTFTRLQINLDDTEDEDILAHLVPALSFIEAELDKGWGVLVHCQAGLSRSVTIVAAYLMYVQHIDPQAALELIKKARTNIEPNAGFRRQLEIFHAASYKVSRRDKATRMFYLERVVQDVMNGDGSVETDFFAKFPRTPSDSTPPTPSPGPRRRIRCKMCRQELAAREHMLDHGQLGPATPAGALSPATSRRPSMHDGKPFSPFSPYSPPGSRRPSMHDSKPLNPLSPLSPSSPGPSRRPSTHEPTARSRLGSNADNRPLRSSLLAMEGAVQLGQDVSDLLSESAVEEEDDDSGEEESPAPAPKGRREKEVQEAPVPPSLTSPVTEPLPAIPPLVARRLSSSTGLSHPSDLAAQLYAHPKLAPLRSPPALSMTPMTSSSGAPSPTASKGFPFSPPILVNPKCSGYFVEPMQWMEFFLEEGQMAGKIICPNKKCGAKLGNYDWAGVCCSCKEWVTPGFCIHRSKVDEVVV
ncbi:uncharacterized protein LAESUDRAFT_660706 [Laetiporus sulphureus 93-53]|uniref:protein-tyrosine-phosphatase n=1 Tax=Laetiporus sulphureus 93-53 TaxID=1314785 RepID=A0A165CKE6_9APHY|nr:uncharacterized protein LAESUDRAFT_660706 [Laetiporus sulphureus 93-53]KZT02973.1 hypothetical protein LAESUDRAFT_660706 [Laetiporus sulphureus 93-53]